MSGLPLAGIRVLDLTSVVVGPATTLRLADLGAEIIKIEAPDGDLLRTLGGPSHSGALSGKFLHFNRDKKFVCLNLRAPRALAALRRILAGCDVLLTNIRPDALARMKLDAKAARAEKPDLIHCAITGFGAGGPYRGKPAYDTVLQAASGLAGLSIARDGEPNFAPFLAVDHVVGEIAASAVCAALFGRERTGEGATIEVPMLETMAAFVLKEHLGAATFEPPLGPSGDKRVLDPQARPVRTSDGWIAITANTDTQARAFLDVVGRSELIDDPRFSSVAARVRNSNAWFTLRAESLADHSTKHWLAVFTHADIPAMPCNTLESLPADPHIKAVGLIGLSRHPVEGDVNSIRPTVLFDDEIRRSASPARDIGWDTRDVLRAAGMNDREINDLVADGAAIDGRTEAIRGEATMPGTNSDVN
jgi:crotonobetainyl-CoA:carnitine CoA-transferase CaiB-like acyl-CoA transferase